MFIRDTIEMQDYTKVKTIGHGSFGKVCIIQENATKDLYAAKIIYRSNSENYLTLLRREVNILSKYRHPAILRYKGFNKFGFKTKKRPVIVTEYMANGSLNRILYLLLHNKPVEGWTETKKLINIYGIADAMSYLHSNNIIHRDLKPDNILLDDHLFPIICDFGLSKVLNKNQNTLTQQTGNNFIGTPQFASPEARHQYIFTKEGDVYSFGLIAYSILTNEMPIENNFNPKLANLPHNFRDLISRCWAKDPNKRPTFDQIVSELKEDSKYWQNPRIDEEEYKKYIEYVDNPDQFKNFFPTIQLPEPPEEGLCPYKVALVEDINNEEFNNLPADTKEIIKQSITMDMSSVHLDWNKVTTLHKNKSLSNPVFINFIQYFSEVLLEVNFPSEEFKDILDILADIKKRFMERMKISVTISGIEEIKKDFVNNEYINIIKILPPVKKIDPDAFRGCIKLEEISISEGPSVLGSSIFRGCAYLKMISIPKTVTTIGEHALRGAHRLTHIVIPPSVTTIEKSVFRGCFSLVEISLKDSHLQKFDRSTFRGCAKLKELIIPPTVTLIEDNSCEKLSLIKEIKIPPSVTEVRTLAFRGCRSLKEVTVDPYVTKIESDAFQECFELNTLKILTSQSKIGPFDMSPFTNVTKIVIPDNVTYIEPNSFSNFASITEISIPSSVTLIEKKTFDGFVSLNQITIDPYRTKVEKGAFQSCKELHSLIISTSETKIRPFEMNLFPCVTKVSIPENVSVIEASVFKDWKELKDITIPSTLTLIGESCFEGCVSLSEVSIPSTVAEIQSKAFKGCISLSNVTYDPYKTKVEEDSFEGCTNIQILNITTTERSIKPFNLKPFASIKMVIIPVNIARIEANVFANLVSLRDLIIPSSVAEIQSEAFKGCTSLSKITIDPYQTKVQEDTFTGCTKLETLVISTYETSIHPFNISYYQGIKKVFIKQNITLIEENAFANCVTLEEIVIPPSTEVIQSKAFKGCTDLKKVFMDPYNTRVISDAFEDCIYFDTLIILDKKSPVDSFNLKPFPHLDKIYTTSKFGASEEFVQANPHISVIRTDVRIVSDDFGVPILNTDIFGFDNTYNDIEESNTSYYGPSI